ncbi:hypothetical protein, partial, partial [Parasitella parasitica]
NESLNNPTPDVRDIYTSEPHKSPNEVVLASTALDSADKNEDDVDNLESNVLNTLVQLAISVDDETIVTPPFFPSPSRRRSSEDINTEFGQRFTETQESLLVDSLRPIKRTRESIPDIGDTAKEFIPAVKRQRKQPSDFLTDNCKTNNFDEDLEPSKADLIKIIGPNHAVLYDCVATDKHN